MKKIFYIIISVFIISTLGFLIFFRFYVLSKNNKKYIAKTILPISNNQKSDIINNINTDTIQNKKTAINLNPDENLIDIYEDDVNADGYEDQLIAIKQLSDPYVYIVIVIQDPVYKKYSRGEILKTEITHPKTLSIYTLDFGLEEKPAIACSGMTLENKQLLSIYLPTTKNKKLTFRTVAAISADIQIRITNNKKSKDTDLSMYSIHSYDVDQNAPETLNQVKKTFSWDKKTNRYIKIDEKIIPGQKVEHQMLRNLGTGNIKLFKEFLHGLWIQPNTTGDGNRSLYFDNTNKELIFFLNNIQETYTIEHANQRRYGLYIRAKNKSISNIILSIDIEIKSMNEIRVRAIENVARLKIGTTSAWDGVYIKKNDSITTQISNKNNENVKLIYENLNKENTIWINDSYMLKVDKDNFEFKTPQGIKKGNISISSIKDKVIIQLRSGMEDIYYGVDYNYDNSTHSNTITLIPVKLEIENIKNISSPSIILAEQIIPNK